MKTLEELTKVSAIVEKVLAEDERARNDDKWLTWKVMGYFTKIYIPFEDFQKIPSFESIRRVRQKIQNEKNLYKPTSQKVIDRRQGRRIVMQNWAVRE